MLLGALGWEQPREVMPKASEEARKALNLDDAIAEAHRCLGLVLHYYEWDWKSAESEFKEAISLSPTDASLRTMYLHLLVYLSRFDDAMAEAEQALKLDPVSIEANRALAHVLYHSRKYDAAIEQCRKTIDLDPNYLPIYWYLAGAWLGKGEYDAAVGASQRGLNLNKDDPINKTWLGAGYALMGRKEKALQILDELKEQRRKQYFPAYHIAMVTSSLGQMDETFEWLNRAYEEKDGLLTELGHVPLWDPHRDDPRFQHLLRRMNFPTQT